MNSARYEVKAIGLGTLYKLPAAPPRLRAAAVTDAQVSLGTCQRVSTATLALCRSVTFRTRIRRAAPQARGGGRSVRNHFVGLAGLTTGCALCGWTPQCRCCTMREPRRSPSLAKSLERLELGIKSLSPKWVRTILPISLSSVDLVPALNGKKPSHACAHSLQKRRAESKGASALQLDPNSSSSNLPTEDDHGADILEEAAGPQLSPDGDPCGEHCCACRACEQEMPSCGDCGECNCGSCQDYGTTPTAAPDRLAMVPAGSMRQRMCARSLCGKHLR